MQHHRLASFGSVGLGQRVTAMVAPYAASLARIELQLDGTVVTKATTAEVEVLIGSRSIIGPVSGTVLDKIMKYRGQYDHAHFLAVDFTERNGKTMADQEIGAIDLPALGGDAVFVAHRNSAASGTPTVEGRVGFVGRQVRQAANQAQPSKRSQLIHKLRRIDLGNTGGTRFTWSPNLADAWVKRVHFEYAGTDWGVNANGNLHTVEVKMNGRPVHDRITCRADRFYLQERGLVPQSKMYHVDFVADGNIITKSLKPKGAASLEFTLELTAADTVTAYVEYLALPDVL